MALNTHPSVEDEALYQGSFLRPSIRMAPVWLTVLLSILTLGIYYPYWLLKRRDEVNRLAGKKIIHKWVPWLVLILYSVSALVFTIGPFFLNEIAIMLYEYIDNLITVFGVSCIIWYSFRIREVLLEKMEDESINGILTFFLTIWYLQYKINKME
ncbi:hypothetical protein DRW41_21925 [Neobacillus piezotolerans]|uniref:DUF4234 domain-containing protein n=1 Tax=Neobacillus piezotolerans TaxID=2259171 RepID=A0A3D8GKX1_9BACI|nr:DUF4234 domain-containing protein [Neobacillus piezotolerans]RDU34756.1 hypothetical protein DRW41_21925 [Neobacillus piezotolerans]